MSQFNAPAYDIERPSGSCAFTGRQLQPGEPYMATLVEVDLPVAPPTGGAKTAKQPTAPSSGGGLGLKRLDVSLEAWDAGQRPDKLFSYWKSIVPEPNQKKRLFVDDEVLMTLFRRLGEADQPERRSFRFVLGLILMRKKLLRYDGSVERPAANAAEARTEEWWKMTPKGEVTALEMINPHLDEAQIQQVREQLSEILAGEL